MIQELAVCTNQGYTMNLCSPVLKVMYNCDSEDNSENKWSCIVLPCHPRLLLYLILGSDLGRGLQENSPECTLRPLLWAFRNLGVAKGHDIAETVPYFERYQFFLGSTFFKLTV